jgi:hypothetical protein
MLIKRVHGSSPWEIFMERPKFSWKMTSMSNLFRKIVLIKIEEADSLHRQKKVKMVSFLMIMTTLRPKKSKKCFKNSWIWKINLSQMLVELPSM